MVDACPRVRESEPYAHNARFYVRGPRPVAGMKRTPWFNARTQPPVNGGPEAIYEHRCRDLVGGMVTRERKEGISRIGVVCPYCEWRGVVERPKR